MHPTCTASWDPEVIQTRTVETQVFARHRSPVSDCDETLIQCRHLGHHCLLPLVLYPIQFHQICRSSATYRCCYRLDELSLFVVVRLVPPPVHYTP